MLISLRFHCPPWPATCDTALPKCWPRCTEKYRKTCLWPSDTAGICMNLLDTVGCLGMSRDVSGCLGCRFCRFRFHLLMRHLGEPGLGANGRVKPLVWSRNCQAWRRSIWLGDLAAITTWFCLEIMWCQMMSEMVAVLNAKDFDLHWKDSLAATVNRLSTLHSLLQQSLWSFELQKDMLLLDRRFSEEVRGPLKDCWLSSDSHYTLLEMSVNYF